MTRGRFRDRVAVHGGGPTWRGVAGAPLATFCVAALAAILGLLPDAAPLLEWDRAAVAGGQVWRLLTGHLVHFGAEHLAFDVLALTVLGVAAERRGRAALLWTLGIASLAIPLAVAATRSDLLTYRGLSGLDSALFALLLCRLLRESQRAGQRGRGLGLLALAGLFAAKLAVEFAGFTVFVSGADFEPVPVAHATGAVIGVVVGLAVGRTCLPPPDCRTR